MGTEAAFAEVMTSRRVAELGRRRFLAFVGGAAGAAAASCDRSGGPVDAPKPGTVRLTAGRTIPRRRLGRTGVTVSAIGIGGAHLGETKDESEAIRIVRIAIDH